jgi:hypothetical protein
VGRTSRIQPALLKESPRRIALSRYALRIDRQRHDSWRQVGIGVYCSVVSLVREQISDVRRGVVIEARDEGRDAGVSFDLRGIEVQLSAPDEAGLLAQVDDLLEEALEDVDAEALPDAGQAGVVGEGLVQGVPEIPAMRQIQTSGLDELALGRIPSKNITNCSLKKTTGSILGRPRSAYNSRVHSRTNERSSFASR